jgi:hypothetical protein
MEINYYLLQRMGWSLADHYDRDLMHVWWSNELTEDSSVVSFIYNDDILYSLICFSSQEKLTKKVKYNKYQFVKLKIGDKKSSQKFSILKTAETHKIYTFKVQRTSPNEGYHIWHFEDTTRMQRNRLLTFMVYLNDIEDGGETEFLYLSKRIKPVAGRVLIWPAGYTHTHRGNPPLKDTKYIITGWVEF